MRAPSNYPMTYAAQKVCDYAVTVLGGEAQADAWLRAPHPSLKGKTPMEIIRSSPGKVENLLYAIEEGF